MSDSLVDKAAAADFGRARQRSFLRKVWSSLSGEENRLLAFDEVKDALHVGGVIYCGLQSVPLDKIIGSVNRYHDFDRAFLPTQAHTQDRWRSISRAFYQDINLPPVRLWRVGDAYFVADGNHRVSVARAKGLASIDADVCECEVRVPVTPDLTPEDLSILGERVEFLERTRLDRLRPKADIQLTILGGYYRLLEHIAVRRYFLGLEWQRDISEDEAVTNWYDLIYVPLVKIIREQKILRDFPHHTESDLYLWIMDHKHYLQNQFGDDLGAAAADFAEQYGERPLKKLMRALGRLLDDLIGDDT